MTFRRLATGAALAIAGLAAAVGIGLLANSISGDSVGLGAEPLSAGGTLAPASVQKAEAAAEAPPAAAPPPQPGRRRDAHDHVAARLTNQIAPAEPGDDNGGDRGPHRRQLGLRLERLWLNARRLRLQRVGLKRLRLLRRLGRLEPLRRLGRRLTRPRARGANATASPTCLPSGAP